MVVWFVSMVINAPKMSCQSLRMESSQGTEASCSSLITHIFLIYLFIQKMFNSVNIYSPVCRFQTCNIFFFSCSIFWRLFFKISKTALTFTGWKKTDIFQNVFICVPQMKENNTGLSKRRKYVFYDANVCVCVLENKL